MQTAQRDQELVGFPVKIPPAAKTLSPAAMACHLRRTDPTAARCFAQAMYEESAWANEAWGAYWADVVELV